MAVKLTCSLLSRSSSRTSIRKAAHLPKRGSDLAAGYDLCAAYDIVVAAHGKGIAKTDLAMAIPAVSGAAPSGAGVLPALRR